MMWWWHRRVYLDYNAGAPPHVVHYFQVKKTTGGAWKVGDIYGVPVSPVAKLPKTIFFGSFSGKNTQGSTLNPDAMNYDSMMVFTFKPDGTPITTTQEVELLSLDPDPKRFTKVEVNSYGDADHNPKNY